MRARNIIFLLAILIGLGVYFHFSRPVEQAPVNPQTYMWSVEMEDITSIKISLINENAGQSFLKLSDQTWHFDNTGRTPVDMQRWGGGIPLLLSGPRADRLVAENATAEQLAEYGLANPQMVIDLTMKDSSKLKIDVGDSAPNGQTYYIKSPDELNDVGIVDRSWFEVMQRLVKEPPYPTPTPTAK